MLFAARHRYFALLQVVKPTLARGFNYKDMNWADLPRVPTAQATLAPEIEAAIAQVT